MRRGRGLQISERTASVYVRGGGLLFFPLSESLGWVGGGGTRESQCFRKYPAMRVGACVDVSQLQYVPTVYSYTANLVLAPVYPF